MLHPAPASGSPASDLERRKMASDIVRVECRTGKSADALRRISEIAFAHDSVRRNLEAAVQRSLDDLGIDADPFRLCQDARRLGAILRLLDEFSGAKCGPDQGCNNLRVLFRPILPDR